MPDNGLEPIGVRLARHRYLLFGVAAAGLCAVGLAALGLPPGASPLSGVAALLHSLLTAGPIALGYLLAAAGWGWPITRLLARQSPHAPWLQPVIGLAVLLWLSHLLGVLGAFPTGAAGQLVALATLGAGWGILAQRAAVALRQRRRLPRLPGSALAAVPGLAVLLLAACNPPGWLWRSEAGGFDSLSYHLQLPIEWASQGRLWPLTHNVYSFLPSYIEAAFLHIHVALGGGRAPAGAAGGLHAAAGAGLLGCQLLHAGCTVLAAALVGRIVWAAAPAVSPGWRRTASGLAAAAVLCTPWAVVTGSLSYNEMAVAALFAGALLIAIDAALPPLTRGLLAGLLVGAATGCKPTAVLLTGPTVALALLVGHLFAHRALAAAAAPRHLRPLAIILVGALLGGTLTFAPPLIRNYAACGNPVFPAAASLFGSAHWTPEQAARFTAGHRESAPPLDRAALLISRTADPTAVDNEPRGFGHGHWSLLPPLAALAMLIALLAPGSPQRRALTAALLLGLLAGCLWWIFFTHCQSRFLVPLVITLALALGLGAAAVADFRRNADPASANPPAPPANPDNLFLGLPPARRLTVMLLLAVPLMLGADTIRRFLAEGPVAVTPPPGVDPATVPDTIPCPNFFLAAGPSVKSGEAYRAELAAWSPDEVAEFLDSAAPYVVINLQLDRFQGLYLLGDSTPLYIVGRDNRTLLYHTTWDTSPLGQAIRANPNDPATWAAALASRNVRHILVNIAELRRLHRSAWYDPDVTPESVTRFLEASAEQVRAWPASGQALFRLRTPAPGATPPTPPSPATPPSPGPRTPPASQALHLP
ncbi:MAG: hypothetical protein LW650_08420 [Planctomycetaceae bacterium]|jgi:hypothetical protein|nr:hypothetical protein [Planctomycetaceae bacterium]